MLGGVYKLQEVQSLFPLLRLVDKYNIVLKGDVEYNSSEVKFGDYRANIK